MSKHSAALSEATAPVVDQAAAAYAAAQAIHDERENYDAVAKFDDQTNVYNPRKVAPLLSASDLGVRVQVLAGLQCYSQLLVEITNGTTSKALDDASKSIGNNLTAIANNEQAAITGALGLASPTSTSTSTSTTTTGGVSTTSTTSTTTPAALVSPGARNAIGTAFNALGQFLVGRTIKKDLPQQIVKMDPTVQALCQLLTKEIDLLRDQEHRDFEYMIEQQTIFIRVNDKLTPQQKRDEIMKLPGMARREQTADDQLVKLRAAIVRLSLTHTALAADAQGNNPESLKSKLGELVTAGEGLATFYSSLPTQ
jgi:mannitol-1-phosphate/altronate dehydrogenase